MHSTPIPSTGTVDVFFSPRAGVTEAIVQEINGAKREITKGTLYHIRANCNVRTAQKVKYEIC